MDPRFLHGAANGNRTRNTSTTNWCDNRFTIAAIMDLNFEGLCIQERHDHSKSFKTDQDAWNRKTQTRSLNPFDKDRRESAHTYNLLLQVNQDQLIDEVRQCVSIRYE
jgi:hypothetical protein